MTTACLNEPGRSEGETARPDGETVRVAVCLPSKVGMAGMRGVPAIEGGMEEPGGGGKMDAIGTVMDPPGAKRLLPEAVPWVLGAFRPEHQPAGCPPGTVSDPPGA